MKPILFNAEMVRAILDGRKTVTRRVIHIPNYGYFMTEPPRVVSRYQTGDILYVRETWTILPITPGGHFRPIGVYYYKADGDMRPDRFRVNGWHPSIHMPKEAARIFLRVQDVHVERLQDITEDEAAKEGADPAVEFNTPEGPEILYAADGYYAIGFKAVWNRTVKPADLPRYGWDANPWVWVIDFERISRDEALKEESK